MEPAPLEQVRGLEGEAANHYFGAFDHLITGDKESFFFHERTRRPPRDNMNALLSFMDLFLDEHGGAAPSVVGSSLWRLGP